jgi:alpha-L-fucosidase 2
MVFGNPSKEKIQLNKNTIWADQPQRNDYPDAKEALPKVKQLIFTGKYRETQYLVNRNFISRNSQGMPYQALENLDLSFTGHENSVNYYRELNIETTVTTTRYDVDGVKFRHEVFAWFPDQVIIRFH